MQQEFGSDMGGEGPAEGGGPVGEGDSEGGGEDQVVFGEAAREQLFEISPEAERRFKDQHAAVKKLWKEEQKFRKDDNKVAAIIIKFLQNPSRTKFFILLARLVARNVPSAFLLALLSLINEESEKETLLQLNQSETGAELPPAEKPKSIELRSDVGEFQKLPPEIKSRIDMWTQNIFKVGQLTQEKILHSLTNEDSTVEETFFQLGTFVLQDYLDTHKIKNDYQEIRNFIDVIFRKMLHHYMTMISAKKVLERPEKEEAGSGGEGQTQ